jgi:hypothetical protein
LALDTFGKNQERGYAPERLEGERLVEEVDRETESFRANQWLGERRHENRRRQLLRRAQLAKNVEPVGTGHA